MKSISFTDVKFKLGILGLALILTGCGEGTVSDAVPKDPVTLSLDSSSTIPSSNQTGVSVKPTINIVVLEELDIETVTKSTVHLMPGENHNMADTTTDDDVLEDSNMDVISGTVFYEESTRKISFVPESLLSQGQSYHVHLAGVKLKDGTPVEDGMHSIHYNFTTIHSHEVNRKEYNESGELRRETVTEINPATNQRLKRTRYDGEANNGAGVVDRIDYYNTTLGGREVSRYRTDAAGIVQFYRAQIFENGEVVANASFMDNGDSDYFNDPLSGYWTPDLIAGDHEITYHYSVVDDDNGAFWASDRTSTFSLSHVSFMEMNHQLAVDDNATGNFQHRHIFYGDIGENGLDLDDQGNPAPVDDKIRVYHTRDMENGLRIRSWSWYGTGSGEGADETLFTDDDLAYQLRVYSYDSLGRREKRTTYSVSRRNNEPGKTRAEWLAIANDPTQTPHSYRSYFYHPTTHVLTEMREFDYDDNGIEILDEIRTYESN